MKNHYQRSKEILITVIIPTYNRVNVINKTLGSVSAQTFNQFECLIIDDHSTDKSSEIIQDYIKTDQRFKYHLNYKSKGAPGARNCGIELAKGKYITFLDSDDLLLPHCLQNRISCFRNSSKIDIVIGMQKILDNGKESFFINFKSNKNPLLRFFSLGPSIDIPWINNTLIKKSFLINNKIKWDETIKLYQDIQFNLNIMIKQPKIKWSNAPFDSYWVQDKNIESIGKEKQNRTEKLKKIISIYFHYKNEVKSYNEELYNKLNKQYHSFLLFVVFQISLLEKDSFNEFINFIKSHSKFSEIQLKLMIRRNLLDHTISKKTHHKLNSKLITFYLKMLNKAPITKGTFCKIQ